MPTPLTILNMATTLEEMVSQRGTLSVYCESLNRLLLDLTNKHLAKAGEPYQAEMFDTVLYWVDRMYQAMANCPSQESYPEQFAREIEPILEKFSFICSVSDLTAIPDLVEELESATRNFNFTRSQETFYLPPGIIEISEASRQVSQTERQTPAATGLRTYSLFPHSPYKPPVPSQGLSFK